MGGLLVCKDGSLTAREFNFIYKLPSYPKKTFTRSRLMDELVIKPKLKHEGKLMQAFFHPGRFWFFSAYCICNQLLHGFVSWQNDRSDGDCCDMRFLWYNNHINDYYTGGNSMKTAVVTGGGKGIGAAICKRLADDGFFVVICYNSSQKEAIGLQAELKDALAVKADLSKNGGAELLYNAIEEARLSPASVLVNNAGVSNQKLLFDITEEEIESQYKVNLKSVFDTCKLFVPKMVQAQYGRVINISSMWGVTGASCEVVYSAVKAGVIGFTKAFAKEVGPSRVTVNCIAPGVIMTDMCKNLSEETLKELKEETPLMKLGTPEDVANAVSFLASENAGFITGQVLGVNGGFVI